jgi:UDP-2,3-diacylglucosamine pyrophosphatase LpxH
MDRLERQGDVGYTLLLWINRIYNIYRTKKGLPYFSLSQSIKQKVKSAVSYVSNFEEELVALARTRHVDGIICGHIHHPADRQIEGIHYLNSGDWVETMSALLEHEDGSWEVYMHRDAIAREYSMKKKQLTTPEEKPILSLPSKKGLRVAFSN